MRTELLMRCSSVKRLFPSSFELSYIREGLALVLWRLGQDRKAQRLREGVLMGLEICAGPPGDLGWSSTTGIYVLYPAAIR